MFPEYLRKQKILLSQFSPAELLESKQWFFDSDFGHSYYGDIQSLISRFCDFEHESQRENTLRYCLDNGYLQTAIGEFKFLPDRATEYSTLIENKYHEKM